LMRADDCLSRLRSPWKYYSSLTMLVHLWRDYSRQIFTGVHQRFGAEVAVKDFRRMVPKCIAG
jgi:hypothetical protein